MKKPNDLIDLREAVKAIKTAILKSRYLAARKVNFEHLKLYFWVGAYVSSNSRTGTWGTGAIEAISEQLSCELPGLRGFSASNIKNMRQFFEEWTVKPNRQLTTGELSENDLAAFFSIGFTHHMEIIFKCRTVAERLFYIRKCAMEFWPVEELKRYILANDYKTSGKVINNLAVMMWRHQCDRTKMDPRMVRRFLEMAAKAGVPTAPANLEMVRAHIPEVFAEQD